jgi:hypothetical protein
MKISSDGGLQETYEERAAMLQHKAGITRTPTKQKPQ